MADNEKKSSRRAFFGKMVLLGTGAATGATVVLTGLQYEKKKDAKGKVQLLTADNRLVEVDASELSEVKLSPAEELQVEGREGIANRRWVWVIDLAKCRNARKCIAACQKAHDLHPWQYHVNVLQMQDGPEQAPYNMPKPCQHCDNPPCVSVCPVDATFKRQDGVVLIDNERCIGCRFCIAACPYSARIFHWTEPKIADEHKGMNYNIELNVPQRKGTISKCLMSSDRLRVGKLPYCVEACPNSVYWFGDENEDAVTNGTTKETMRFSDLIEKNGGYRLLDELGTKPRVYYLPPKNRLFPFEKTEDTIEKS
jgi:Fe-S-cluster-containing dehydrogenase component